MCYDFSKAVSFKDIIMVLNLILIGLMELTNCQCVLVGKIDTAVSLFVSLREH